MPVSRGVSGALPARPFTMAVALALPCALAAAADFGMPPPRQASPITCTSGKSFDANVIGSIGHQPVLSAAPAICALRPDDVGDLRDMVAEFGDNGVGGRIDGGHPAAVRQRYALDHAVVELVPRLLEQPL